MVRRAKKQKPPDRYDRARPGAGLPRQNRYTTAAVCGALVLAVLAVFGGTLGNAFVHFDDKYYVYENQHVLEGLTAKGIAWALTAMHAGNWHPLTWLSHMLDCQFYGLWAGGHHLTSVLLHAAAAALLFLVLRGMTGDLWPSALAAAIFAVHPLRVESVAWAAERKDVLSGLFFMLTLAAYLGYVRHPFSWLRYLAVAVLLALGLMAKPMLVTLPFVLLLLDYWPLGRIKAIQRPKSLRSFAPALWLVVEKLPLLVISAASCAVTSLAQTKALVELDDLPLGSRAANAVISTVAYLGQFFYPAGLAAFYPLAARDLSAWRVAGASVLLASICLGLFVWRRRCPYLLVGWLWYLGMLVPVIGLVQVGSQSMADRYTYLPQIGLAIGLAWATKQVFESWPYRVWLYGAVSVLTLAALMGCAWRQVFYWRDTETMWRRALDCTSHNALAHSNLAVTLREKGRTEEAIAECRSALRIAANNFLAHNTLGVALCEKGELQEGIDHLYRALQLKPECADAHNNLGLVLAKQGRVDEARVEYEKALENDPDCLEAHVNLGALLSGRGRAAEAVPHYRKALEIAPQSAEAHNNLGNALAAQGKQHEAIAEYRRALEIKPDYAQAHYNLGGALYRQGQTSEAIVHWERVLRLQPQHISTLNQLAWVLATSPDASVRNGPQAVPPAQRAAHLTGNRDANILDTLAAAYAAAGRFPEARETARKALELAAQQGQEALAELIKAKLPLYEAGTPFRDAAPLPAPTPMRP